MSFVGGVGGLRQEVSPAGSSEAVQTVVSMDKTTDVTISNVQHGDLTELSSTGGLVAQALGGVQARARQSGFRKVSSHPCDAINSCRGIVGGGRGDTSLELAQQKTTR